MISSPRWLNARSGSVSPTRRAGLGSSSSSTMIATNAIAISAAVPKNGPRQEIPPRKPPSSGPEAMPSPRAAS